MGGTRWHVAPNMSGGGVSPGPIGGTIGCLLCKGDGCYRVSWVALDAMGAHCAQEMCAMGSRGMPRGQLL